MWRAVSAAQLRALMLFVCAVLGVLLLLLQESQRHDDATASASRSASLQRAPRAEPRVYPSWAATLSSAYSAATTVIAIHQQARLASRCSFRSLVECAWSKHR